MAEVPTLNIWHCSLLFVANQHIFKAVQGCESFPSIVTRNLRPFSGPYSRDKNESLLQYLISSIIPSAEQWTHQHSLQARRCGSPHRARTRYSLESPCRLDDFWQRPAVTPLQSPQVWARVDFWIQHIFCLQPPSCLTASEACEETSGPSRVADFSSGFSLFFVLDCLCLTDWFIYRSLNMAAAKRKYILSLSLSFLRINKMSASVIWSHKICSLNRSILFFLNLTVKSFDGALSNIQWNIRRMKRKMEHFKQLIVLKGQWGNQKNLPLWIHVHEKQQKWTKNAISNKSLLNDHQELIAFSVSPNSLSTKNTFLESLGATTYACSYLNLAVRQLIKPLHLSNACSCLVPAAGRLCFQWLWLLCSSPLGVPHHWYKLAVERKRRCSLASEGKTARCSYHERHQVQSQQQRQAWCENVQFLFVLPG